MGEVERSISVPVRLFVKTVFDDVPIMTITAITCVVSLSSFLDGLFFSFVLLFLRSQHK